MQIGVHDKAQFLPGSQFTKVNEHRGRICNAVSGLNMVYETASNYSCVKLTPNYQLSSIRRLNRTVVIQAQRVNLRLVSPAVTYHFEY